MAGLLYGSGLRLMECVRLRVKDIDFALAQINVRDSKGGKDRVTMLPLNLVEPLQRHLIQVKAQHEQDLEDGFGRVQLPFAIGRKYPTPRVNGRGSMSFLLRVFRSIRAVVSDNDITSPKAFCRRR